METSPQQSAPESVTRSIVFTEAAVSKIREFLDNKEEARGKMLRIFVQGGGCSGFEYGFSFDEPKDNDLHVPQGQTIKLLQKLVNHLYSGGISRWFFPSGQNPLYFVPQ